MPLVSALRLAGVNCTISRKFSDEGTAGNYRNITGKYNTKSPSTFRTTQDLRSLESAEFKISLLTYEMGVIFLRVFLRSPINIAYSKEAHCHM